MWFAAGTGCKTRLESRIKKFNPHFGLFVLSGRRLRHHAISRARFYKAPAPTSKHTVRVRVRVRVKVNQDPTYTSHQPPDLEAHSTCLMRTRVNLALPDKGHFYGCKCAVIHKLIAEGTRKIQIWPPVRAGTQGFISSYPFSLLSLSLV